MLTATSLTVVFVFGFLLFMVASWGVAAPQQAFASMSGLVQRRWGLPSAVAMRLVLGIALVLGAAESRFPVLFQVLGWITIVAAVALVVMGRERTHRLMESASENLAQAKQWIFLVGVALAMLLVLGTM